MMIYKAAFSAIRIASMAIALAPWSTASAQAFDFAGYQAVDIDALLDRPRPTGVENRPPARLKIAGTLATYGEPCDTSQIKISMAAAGIEQARIDAVPVTRCIKLRTAKGHTVSLAIQDVVAGFLPQEIPLGGPITLFVLQTFASADGPGMVVNEFKAGSFAPNDTPHAFKPPSAGDGIRGEWRRTGAAFACVVASPQKLSPSELKPDVLEKACLHIGPFMIGSDARKVTSALGAPHRVVPQPKNANSLIYFLEQSERHPYLVVTVLNETIVALQVTGPTPAKDYSFNNINLGDSTETLSQQFGPARQTNASSDKDTVVWSYRPWPFSFEVNAGRVTSIRIADPSQ